MAREVSLYDNNNGNTPDALDTNFHIITSSNPAPTAIPIWVRVTAIAIKFRKTAAGREDYHREAR